MNKKSIITMMLALVTMTGLAQTKTATVTGYSPALKDGTLVLAAFSLMLHTDVSLTARFYELMMASVLAISA